MKLKKRKKHSRLRGARTCGYGFRQKHKGRGNKGGHGMAGTGKRADHKKQKALIMAKKAGFETYFGKKGFTSRSFAKKKIKTINLEDIKANFSGNKIDLKNYKILGQGDGFKAEISAKSASKSAVEKMEKANGRIIIVGGEVEKKTENKKQATKLHNLSKQSKDSSTKQIKESETNKE